eukprot:scpid31410/ scgid3224/ Ankyrin repeat domain-containing protein 55
MSGQEAQERIRTLLGKNRAFLQQQGVASDVLDAFEQNGSRSLGESSATPDAVRLSPGGVSGQPLATSSPIARSIRILGNNSDIGSVTESTVAAEDPSRSGCSASSAPTRTHNTLSPALRDLFSSRGRNGPPIEAWTDGSRKADALAINDSSFDNSTSGATTTDNTEHHDDERSLSSMSPTKTDLKVVGTVPVGTTPSPVQVNFVDLPSQPSSTSNTADGTTQRSTRTAWHGESACGVDTALFTSRQATHTCSSSSSGHGSINNTPAVATADDKPQRSSKHAARRQKQFRKKVAPEMAPSTSSPEAADSTDPVSSPDVVTEGILLGSQAAEGNDDAIEERTATSSLATRGGDRQRPASSADGDSGLRNARLPATVSLPPAPDTRKPVRPAAPPPYFLPAHQESRPADLSALPCPEYGDYNLAAAATPANSSFNAFSGKPSTGAPKPSAQSKAKPRNEANTGDAQIPPLHHAAWVGDSRRIKELLSQGHHPDALDSHDRTALMYSCSSHGVNIFCADALLRAGANLDHQANDGSSPLHEAAYVGALSLIELLVHNGASASLRDDQGRLPMHYATYNKTEKCLKALLKAKNTNINASDKAGMTALMWAAYHDRPTICTYLAKLDADQEEKDVDGRTAMHWAVHKTNITCLKLLLEHDMTYFKDHKGLTVLHIAAEKGSVKAARFIISIREDSVHDLDKNGRSPLHWAAVCSRVDVCAVLLEFGASPNLKDKHGLSPLDYSKQKSLSYVSALFTCFDWDSRPNLSTTASRISLLNRWSGRVAPMSARPAAAGSSADVSSAGTADTRSLVSVSSTGSGSMGKAPDTQQSITLPEDYRQLLEDGTYMKVFTDDGKGPLQDKYFWVTLDTRHICWCKRRADRILGDYSSARALSITPGVEETVKARADYKPATTHRHSMVLKTTSFVMTTLAYTPQHFKAWTQGFGSMLQNQRADSERPLSPLWAGDAWGAVNQRSKPTSSAQGLFQTVASNQSTGSN